MSETGHISIHTENILPIIKKWLYAEKEIFVRELVSNAADAILKLQKISLTETLTKDVPEPRITIAVNKEAKTLTIQDTGLGMTADEIKKYINQVAFSGVQDFVEKYQGKDDQQQIIGHFGLGFYSAFMVASKVEIDTLSYKDESKAAHWICDGSTSFTLSDSERTTVGTTITLHIGSDSEEVLEEYHVKSLIRKYCGFLPYPIVVGDETINDTQPLWTKNPSSLKDEDYKEFFQKHFPMSEAPLFWIHLNVDYPFKLRGVLYFPKLKHELDASQGQIKMFCNQVFVADNCKELLPDFLTLLKGMIDCPDLPLNVSRSYLQNDRQVQLIAQHITKKIADKLSGLAKNEREVYESYWEDISPFIKFGMLRDDKFADRMREHVIFKLTNQTFKDLDSYLESYKALTKDKIIYTSQPSTQASYVALLKESGIDCVIADTLIDQHFLPFLEMTSKNKWEFLRCDSDILSHVTDESKASTIVDPQDQKKASDQIKAIFEKTLGESGVKIRVEALRNEKIPAFIVLDEKARRMQEFASMSAFSKLGLNQEKQEKTLVINECNPAVKNVIALSKAFNKEHEEKMLVKQIYDLALLQHAPLTPEGMQSFIERTSEILGRI